MRAGCRGAAAAAVVVAVLAAGCGGSSAPSRASYGKDVDRICATLEDRVDAVQRDRPSTPDELVAFADKLARTLDDGVRELKAVDRPDGDDGVKAQRWLDALQRQSDDAKAALAALKEAARKRDGAAVARAIHDDVAAAREREGAVLEDEEARAVDHRDRQVAPVAGAAQLTADRVGDREARLVGLLDAVERRRAPEVGDAAEGHARADRQPRARV